jgi:hypothetical protein
MQNKKEEGNFLSNGNKEPTMPYKPIEIDRKNLAIMGVSFSSVSNFKATVNAIGTTW